MMSITSSGSLLMGARSQAKARRFFGSCFRRHWGVTAMFELARLLLARLCFAGSSAVCCVMQAGELPAAHLIATA